MARLGRELSSSGAWIIAAAALAGLGVSIFNYFNIDSGIAREPGTVLVIASTAILLVFGLLMNGGRERGFLLRGFVAASCLLNLAGTGFAAYLLHSQALLILMGVGLVGWLVHVFRRRPAVA